MINNNRLPWPNQQQPLQPHRPWQWPLRIHVVLLIHWHALSMMRIARRSCGCPSTPTILLIFEFYFPYFKKNSLSVLNSCLHGRNAVLKRKPRLHGKIPLFVVSIFPFSNAFVSFFITIVLLVKYEVRPRFQKSFPSVSNLYIHSCNAVSKGKHRPGGKIFLIVASILTSFSNTFVHILFHYYSVAGEYEARLVHLIVSSAVLFFLLDLLIFR